MQAKIWYTCDPNKNKQCNKRNCKHNPNAYPRTCERTSHIEFSVDGKPIEDAYPRSKKTEF